MQFFVYNIRPINKLKISFKKLHYKKNTFKKNILKKKFAFKKKLSKKHSEIKMTAKNKILHTALDQIEKSLKKIKFGQIIFLQQHCIYSPATTSVIVKKCLIREHIYIYTNHYNESHH